MSKVPSLSTDEFAGQGGEYLLNPKTGQRELITRTAPAPAPEPIQTDATSQPQTDNPDQN